jgi:ankyrin repeat protein
MVALDLSRLMSETDVTARDRTDRIVTDLLDKGANANLVGGYDTYVMPVLIHAVAANRYECVSLLLAHGANPNQEGPSGSTALEFVRDVRTAKLLVKYGADFRHRNADGSTVLASIKQGPYAHDLLNYLVGIGAPE